MKKYIVVFLSTAILISGFIYMNFSLECKETVSVLNPIRTTVEDFVESTGKISAKNSVKVLSKDGVVSKLYYKVGDYVEKGDKIAEVLYTENAEELIKNNANIDINNINIEQIKSIKDVKVDVIKATSSGYIMEQNVGEGKIITNDYPVAIISDFADLEVITSVSENKIDSLKAGMSVWITGEGFKDKIYTGKIVDISPIAKQNSLNNFNSITVDVVISITNPDSKLRPGNSVNAKILTNTTENCMVIPYEAIRIDEQNNSFVYVVSNNTVEKRIITTSNESSVGVMVLSGLDDNDIIVNNANGELVGKKIAPKELVK